MENAVIYARFSSSGQNEQSIESQIRTCREFAESQGYNIVNTYSDKARTGTNDSRPSFQRMIKDARNGAFQYIIVYMFDRFARNRRDSIMYKEMLKQDYGIRVLSATQPISDDEGGEFYEMFLEWNDEKYSKRLSKRVRNGLDTSVENGTFCGGYLIYGYKIRKEPIAGKRDRYIKYVEIDVEKKDIAAALNEKGLRLNGKPFTGKSFDKWIVNPKYTGEFYFGERFCDHTYPAIIDKALFERVQKRLAANRYFAGGMATARVPYLLTGKAFCAKCETPMIADGGTSKTGKKYQYYACKTKKKHACDKENEDKDILELCVTQVVRDFLSDKKNAEIVVKDTLAYYDRRTGADSIKSIETRIAKAHKDVEEMANAFIEAKSSLLRATIEKKMSDYEKLIDDLESQKAQLERERGLRVSEKDLLDFIDELMDGDTANKDYQRKIIDNLVYKVFVDDDNITPFLTIGNGDDVANVRLSELKEVLGKLFGARVQTQLPPARHGKAASENGAAFLFFCGAIRLTRARFCDNINKNTKRIFSENGRRHRGHRPRP